MRIEVQKATKRFGKLEVLRGVDLVVPRGRRVALVGPNGSGKSTLIRALLGLIDCEGSVSLDGRSPYDARIEVAKRLAYVPQIAPALGASVGELCALVCLTRGLDAADVAAIAARLNLDLEAVRKRPFRHLSGGMKQKVLLALAFAAKPELLVMDEPTASLDEATRQKFFALCRALPEETTVILCSHRLEEVALLTRHVVVMEEGRVTFDGPAEQYSAGAVSPARAGGDGALVLEPAFARAEAPRGDDRE
jgi:ABC-type multidrug transport system ATPase subunit